MLEGFFTSRELAERWKFTPETMKKWRCAGKGPHHHKMGGRILYSIEDIEQFEKDALRHHTSMVQAPSSTAAK
ncbi:MAG: helix-turn-helix domain-containing protein [Alphaproteobacteria bacterium]|nr:helix-turn-helix domain-containing protein [Alphaproteobacteria bacterium]